MVSPPLPDPGEDDQAVVDTQRSLPRLSLKLLFAVVTLSIVVVWLIRFVIGNQTALSSIATVMLMVVGCFVLYAMTFLFAWSMAKVGATLRRAPPAVPRPGTVLLDSERWQ